MTPYTITPIDDKQTWDAFVSAQPYPQFLQSWNAGEQAKALGEQIIRLGLFKQGALISTLFGSIIRAKRGSYLFVPYGPVCSESHMTEALQTWSEHLSDWAKGESLDFLRFCPFMADSQAARATYKQVKWHTAPIHTLAERVWLLDVRPDENVLLAGMSKTTRNLIRRAAKEGVTITTSTDRSDVDRFLKLHAATKDRHSFTPYPDRLFYEQVKAFAPDDQVVVFCSYHKDTLIASAIIMYYGSMASYHHGASIPSKIPAAYALQWAAIKEAKKRGCTTYNFWGVTDLKDTKHPFYGISLFKTRFGGSPLDLLKSQDLPISRRYLLTYLVESARRIRRGFGLTRS